MSSNLREIVRTHQEESALRKYLGKNYGSTSPQEKRKFIDAVKDSIDREVDLILNAFVADALKGSPAKKRKTYLTLLNLILTILITPGIAYAVNIENWALVGILSAVLLVYQIFLILLDD